MVRTRVIGRVKAKLESRNGDKQANGNGTPFSPGGGGGRRLNRHVGKDSEEGEQKPSR